MRGRMDGRGERGSILRKNQTGSFRLQSTAEQENEIEMPGCGQALDEDTPEME